MLEDMRACLALLQDKVSSAHPPSLHPSTIPPLFSYLLSLPLSPRRALSVEVRMVQRRHVTPDQRQGLGAGVTQEGGQVQLVEACSRDGGITIN